MTTLQAPIFEAIRLDNITVVRDLCTQDPELLYIRGKWRYSPLHYAVKVGSPEMVTEIIRLGKLHIPEMCGKYKFVEIVDSTWENEDRRDDRNILQALLNKDQDLIQALEHHNMEELSPFELAAQEGKHQMMDIFLNSKEYTGYGLKRALDICIKNGDVFAARVLRAELE